MSLICQNDKLYCSYSFLEQYIPKKTIEDWRQREICERIYQDGNAYISYDTIPTPSRSKLPTREELIALAQEQEQDLHISGWERALNKAIDSNYGKHCTYINEHYPDYTPEKRKLAAKKWCIYELAVNGCIEHGQGDHFRAAMYNILGKKSLENAPHLTAAEREKKRFVNRQVFSRTIGKMRKNGIEPYLMDKRKLAKGRKGKSKFTDEVKTEIYRELTKGQKYSAAKVLRLLQDNGRENLPKERIVRYWLTKWKKNPEFVKKRYGRAAANKMLPKQPLEPLTETNVQWQIDGFTLPFWVNGDKPFETHTLIRVIDVCSRKILGYTVAKSENSVSILETLRNAVTATGTVPKELVMDKHSATRSGAFDNFKRTIESIGTEVIISTNPTDKADIERQNQYLNDVFCEYPEWLGEGMSGKNPRRRTEEELAELRKTKNQITPEDVRAKGILACVRFNETPLKPLNGASPAEHYDAMPNSGISVCERQIVSMFTPPVKYTVRGGQIKMSRGTKSALYTLSGENYQQYNDTEVIVHFESFGEDIYVFDLNNNFIECIAAERGISKSKTRRSQDDTPDVIGKKAKINKTAQAEHEALINNPKAANYIPSYLLNKDTYQEVKQRNYETIAQIEGLKVEKKHTPQAHAAGDKPTMPISKEELEDNEAAVLMPLKDLVYNHTKKEQ